MKNKVGFSTKLLIVFCLLFSISSLQIKSQQTVLALGFGNPTTVNGMKGFSVPEGTIATASSVYTGRPASLSIDGKDSTYWTGNGFDEYVELQFPYPLTLDYVQVMSAPLNPSTSKYTIYGLMNNEWKTIGSYSVNNTAGVITPAVAVDHGNYDKIRVRVQMNNSWVGIHEITIGNNQTINLDASARNASVALKWNAVDMAESYTVKYGTESGKYTETTTATKDEHGNFVIPGLTNGTTYYFVVSATVNGAASDYSNEASATPMEPSPTPIVTPVPTATPSPTPEQPAGNRAILVVTMNTGLEKEFDLPMSEVNAFLNWYDHASGSSKFGINKHDNNKGPFSKRTDYVIFDKILTFEVSEYAITE